MGLFDRFHKKDKTYKKGWSSGNSSKYGYKGSTVRDSGQGLYDAPVISLTFIR